MGSGEEFSSERMARIGLEVGEGYLRHWKTLSVVRDGPRRDDEGLDWHLYLHWASGECSKPSALYTATSKKAGTKSVLFIAVYYLLSLAHGIGLLIIVEWTCTCERWSTSEIYVHQFTFITAFL